MVFTSTLITVLLLAAVCPLTGAETPFFADETSVLQVAQHERDLKEHDIAGTRNGTEGGAALYCWDPRPEPPPRPGWGVNCDGPHSASPFLHGWFYENSANPTRKELAYPDPPSGATEPANVYEEATTPGSVRILVMTFNGHLPVGELPGAVDMVCEEIRSRIQQNKNNIDVIMLASQDFDATALSGNQWLVEPDAGNKVNPAGRPLKYCGLRSDSWKGYHQTQGAMFQTEKDKQGPEGNLAGSAAEAAIFGSVANRVEIAVNCKGTGCSTQRLNMIAQAQVNGPGLQALVEARDKTFGNKASWVNIPVGDNFDGSLISFMSVHLGSTTNADMKRPAQEKKAMEQFNKVGEVIERSQALFTIVAGDFAVQLKDDACNVLQQFPTPASYGFKCDGKERSKRDGFFTVVSKAGLAVEVIDPDQKRLSNPAHFTSGIVQVRRQ